MGTTRLLYRPQAQKLLIVGFKGFRVVCGPRDTGTSKSVRHPSLVFSRGVVNVYRCDLSTAYDREVAQCLLPATVARVHRGKKLAVGACGCDGRLIPESQYQVQITDRRIVFRTSSTPSLIV